MQVMVYSCPVQESQPSSRRSFLNLVATSSVLLSAAPASAILGIGEETEKLDAYNSDTV